MPDSLFTADATNVTFFGDVVFDRAAMAAKLADTDEVISAVAITGVGIEVPYALDKVQTISLVRTRDGWRCAAFQNTTMGEDMLRHYNPATKAL